MSDLSTSTIIYSNPAFDQCFGKVTNPALLASYIHAEDLEMLGSVFRLANQVKTSQIFSAGC